MVEINIPDDEKHALGRVDARELDRLIDDALREEPATRLLSLPLSAGAPYVARRLRTFERALADTVRPGRHENARRRVARSTRPPASIPPGSSACEAEGPSEG
ncbi:hypothetical protein [Methylorubrum extorquens]|uniref:Uncharacterized protein n=1 Tax=Methylorubrum extorquens (strain ATCC 14718 / DSM 1338 / JCM 2805 / NCIMB 9133 / AM1) TaxID=272630 RepID=C5B0B2_METEA|nr:hypothetical protein [Methylorubrum extorquens]ACS39462.1 hypothetical protein MexAM1_META1p1603 [Methylorubrum extorquens AM1]MCP1542428.1 hypothetical protein [Methylorubrum extorquens]MCP1590227.1 hypothetical protein [Methylorubrum extorquens]